MQTKIKSFLKKFSIVTTHPDSDWMKIFMLLLVIGVISFGWNVYFFFSVKNNLSSVTTDDQPKAAVIVNTEEEKMKSVIRQYDSRAEAHGAIIREAPGGVADPAGA